MTAATALADRFAWVPADSAGEPDRALDCAGRGPARSGHGDARGLCAGAPRAARARRRCHSSRACSPTARSTRGSRRCRRWCCCPRRRPRRALQGPARARRTGVRACHCGRSAGDALKVAAAAPGLREALADSSLLVVAAAARRAGRAGRLAAVRAQARHLAHAADAASRRPRLAARRAARAGEQRLC